MQRLVRLLAVLSILAPGVLLGRELILNVEPEQAREVIERNEMQYEELRWHSFPDHFRIAKIDAKLLREPGVEFTITFFDDEQPVHVRSNGLDGNRWTGAKTSGGVPEVALRAELEAQGTSDTLTEQLIKLFNAVELQVHTVLTDRDSGAAIAYQGQYQVVPAGDGVSEWVSDVPVFPNDRVREVTSVHGEINVVDLGATPVMYRTFTIRPLEENPEYVMIYEWDNSKNHHLMEPPNDPEAWAKSELGQRYAKLRKEKEAYLSQVAERIAERNTDQQDPD